MDLKRTLFTILAGNEVFLPRETGRLTEWKAEIGDCIQELCSEALFTK